MAILVFVTHTVALAAGASHSTSLQAKAIESSVIGRVGDVRRIPLVTKVSVVSLAPDTRTLTRRMIGMMPITGIIVTV